MKQEHIPASGPQLNDWKEGARQGEDAARAGGPVTEPSRKPGILEAQQAGGESASTEAPVPRQLIEGTTRTFNFNGQPIRAKQDGAEIWFVAADVCRELEHTNPTRAVERLDDDERGLTTIQAPHGSDMQVNVVSESGLYDLIFTSRKPEAKTFRRWVTREVLPAIRKTGRYEHDSNEAKDLGADGEAKQDRPERGEVTVLLPPVGCFVITMQPAGSPQIRETGYYDGIWRQVDATDCRILCHTLRTIEMLWQRVNLLKVCGVKVEDGFTLEKLGETIRQGGAFGQRYLLGYDKCRDRPTHDDSGTPPARRH